jgi:hypothetical protein
MTEPVAQVQRKQKIETGTAVKHIAAFTIVAATALLAMVGGAVLGAQSQDVDKYSLRSPGGIAFSQFREYEDWSVVSSARTEATLPEEILKVIVANPAMIKAFKAGVPGNGQPFPDGSMIVKLQWKPKKSTEAPFAVDVQAGFRDGEGQQEILETRRLGICGVQLRRRIGQFHRRSQKPFRLRTIVPCGREGQGLHLPPVPEALNVDRKRINCQLRR